MKITKFGEMRFDAKGNLALKDFNFDSDEEYRNDYRTMTVDVLKAFIDHFNTLINNISGDNKAKLPSMLNVDIQNYKSRLLTLFTEPKYPSYGLPDVELNAITYALIDIMEHWIKAGLVVAPGVDHNLMLSMTHCVEHALIHHNDEEYKNNRVFNPPVSRWKLVRRVD